MTTPSSFAGRLAMRIAAGDAAVKINRGLKISLGRKAMALAECQRVIEAQKAQIDDLKDKLRRIETGGID